MKFGVIGVVKMWRVALCFWLFVGGISPSISDGNGNGSLADRSSDPGAVAQGGVPPHGAADGLTSGRPASGSGSGAGSGAAGGKRVRADLELEIWCMGDQLTLGVGTKLNGAELIPEALTLGYGCKGNGLSADHLWFTYHLSQCATRETVVDGDVVYSNVIQYAPAPLHPSLKQVEAFSLPVRCTLDRHGDMARPVLMTHSIMMSLPVSTPGHDAGFSLRAMNRSWTSVAETNVYQRGEAVLLQAAVAQLEDEDEEEDEEERQLFVQSCHVTASSDPQSRPRVRLIVKKGCVAHVVSKRGHAGFVPSERPDAVNIEFSAFRFGPPEIYIHCELAVLRQEVTPASKFCNYDRKRQRWEELNGDVDVCSCCKTECGDPPSGSAPPGPRALVTVGPLVVNGVAAANAEPEPPSPPRGEPPAAILRAPSPDAFPQQESLPGYGDVPPQVWMELLAAATEGVAYVDGKPVQGGAWGQPQGAPQGWLAAGMGASSVTWLYPPVEADGGVLFVRHVPEAPGTDVVVGHVPAEQVARQEEDSGKGEDHLETPQSDDGEIVRRRLRDDPASPEARRLDSPALLPPASDPYAVLEESARKRWGGRLGALIQQGEGRRPDRANRKGDTGSRGDEDALAGVGVDDEGLLVRRTEVVMHKGRGREDASVLSAFRSSLALTRTEGADAQKLRYEEEEEGMAEDEDRAMKRRVLLEEDNAQPSSLWAVLRRMYKAE